MWYNLKNFKSSVYYLTTTSTKWMLCKLLIYSINQGIIRKLSIHLVCGKIETPQIQKADYTCTRKLCHILYIRFIVSFVSIRLQSLLNLWILLFRVRQQTYTGPPESSVYQIGYLYIPNLRFHFKMSPSLLWSTILQSSNYENLSFYISCSLFLSVSLTWLSFLLPVFFLFSRLLCLKME